MVVRVAAAGVAVSRIVRASRRRPPLIAATISPTISPAISPTISIVIPARDEALRIGPLLQLVCGAPGVADVVVVDDQSSDGTAEIARAAGARVVAGAELPARWVGKAWALQQGVLAATGDWVVTLDADTRPSPELPRSLVARAQHDALDFVTVGGRFQCPTAGLRWLHPAMLTTLVYRFGPPGWTGHVPAGRQLANGQCMAFDRRRLLAAGGMQPVCGHVIEDVALARHLAGTGWNVAMLEGPDLLTTRMFDDLPHAMNGWSRSLALPGVEPRWRQAAELVLVLAAQALPIPRLLMRRGDVLDVGLALMRLGTLAGTASAYERTGPAFWLSPTADLAAVVALARGGVTRTHRWRGRVYATASG
jgi:dolichol-phosphate mannosyltransferase